MNSEEDEFKRIEREALRRAAQDDDDDTQVYVKPWVGLTDEEVRFYTEKHRALVNAHYDKVADTNIITEKFDSTAFYKDVSAVLKDRNT
jgi:alkanesulfonate monooxygenase SsuD/methylene tetrahydromethanopterin reductase-like flavin-dependent oxidoreductase (luciferase family)